MLFSLHSPTAFKVQLLELLQTEQAETLPSPVKDVFPQPSGLEIAEFEVVFELLALQCQNR